VPATTFEKPTVVSATYRGKCYSGGVLEGKHITPYLDEIDQHMEAENLSRSDMCDIVVDVLKGNIKRGDAGAKMFVSILIWLACRGGMGEQGKRMERLITGGGHTLIHHINRNGADWEFRVEIYPSDEVDTWLPGGSSAKH
jgi:hypothetical protein